MDWEFFWTGSSSVNRRALSGVVDRVTEDVPRVVSNKVSDTELLDALDDFLRTGPIRSLVLYEHRERGMIGLSPCANVEGPTLRATIVALMKWRKQNPYRRK